MRILFVFSIVCCLFLSACFGSSSPATPDADTADSKQVTAIQDKIEIPVGMRDTQVLQLLGSPDSTDTDDSGRQIWRYNGKRAEYVYASNKDNTQTLIIGGYVAAPDEKSGGLPLLVTILLDPAKKVVNFNFAQMAF